MRVSLVPTEAVGHVWKDVDRVLKKAVATVDNKAEMIDILDGIYDGTYVLWVVLDDDNKLIAAMTTRIIEYPRHRSMALDWVGGSRMKEWLDMGMKIIIDFATKNGCNSLEGYGRKAWGRALKKHGFYEDYIAFRTEI